MNDEDQCFDKKLTNELNPLDSLTELEPSLRAFPVPTNFKLKKQALKTNGASSKLGLSILLDPMLHDQINGEFSAVTESNMFPCSRIGVRGQAEGGGLH